MRSYAPVFVLLLMSPLLAEFIFGATPLSRLGGIVPLIVFYGGGVVIIRDLARRRETGWGRIVLLAAAYGIIEEGLVILSMFNPELFKAGLLGGRVLGVNGVWSERTVGYHVVYSIVIPIYLTELLFPERRTEPWLGWKSLTILAMLYFLSAVFVGVVFRRILAPGFATPVPQAAVALLIVIALGAWALLKPVKSESSSTARDQRVPSFWILGILGFLLAGSWFHLLILPSILRTGALVVIPMLATLAMVASYVHWLDRWSTQSRDWTDLHGLAVVIGVLIPMMLFGYVAVTAANRVDQIAQGVSSLLALGLLITIAFRTRARSRSRPEEPLGIDGAS